jgi:hypothetical protein
MKDEFFLVTEKDRETESIGLPSVIKNSILLNKEDIPEIIRVLNEYANKDRNK